MDLQFTYDQVTDLWTFTHKSAQIRTREDAVEWHRCMRQELRKLGGEQVFVLIDVSGLKLAPALIEEYGRITKEIVSEHFLGAVRYGADPTTTTVIVLQSIVNNFPANVFPSREEALKALLYIRSKAVPPKRAVAKSRR